MISGYVTDRRPFVIVHVVIEFADDFGRASTNEQDIPFLVDTGSDVTVLGGRDLTERLRVPLSRTIPGGNFAAFGESFSASMIHGFVFLKHTDGRFSGFRQPLFVAPRQDASFDVSILGCDVILEGELRINASAVELNLPILGA